MAKKGITEELEMPEKVTVSGSGTLFTVKGPKGEVTRDFRSPTVSIETKEKKVILSVEKATKKDKAIINTYKAHFNNMFKGVEEGYVYKLHICSGHFPMNVTFSNNLLSIKNFIGEKVPRTVNIDPKVKLKVSGKEIVVEGPDKELVGQTAADIEQLTRRPGFDKRIFQDGIFIVSKAGKEIA